MADQKHPLYATCTGCTQVKGVTKDGRIKVHTRLSGGGNWQSTVECPGSRWAYAEANGRTWDARKGEWKDMPIEVTTTLHDFDDEQHLMIVESHPFTKAKAGYAIFTDEGYTVHLYTKERRPYGNIYDVELRNGAKIMLKMEHDVADDGHLNGLMLRWLEQLADEAKSST